LVRSYALNVSTKNGEIVDEIVRFDGGRVREMSENEIAMIGVQLFTLVRI